MEIIILMIIVSVIGNIIKSAGQQQQTGPAKKGVPGQGSFPGQWGIPGQGSIPRQGPGKGLHEQSKLPPKVHKYPMEAPESGYQEHDYRTEHIFIEEEADRVGISAPRVMFSQEALPMDREAEIQIVDTGQKKRHKLEFSQESIINGVIMSEVLGPPVSRR